MKKYLLAFTLASIMLAGCGGCGNEVKAQSAQMLPTTAASVGGTTANYDSLNLSLAYKCASFQCNITRISAAMFGTVTLQASNDNGAHWFGTAAGDTVHIANAASQTAVISIAPATGVLYKSYRLYVTQVAGDTVTIKSWFHGGL